MRAAIFTEMNGPLSVEDVTPTDPGPRDVVVQITASGICHSDLSVINGTLPMPPPAILGQPSFCTGVGSPSAARNHCWTGGRNSARES